MRVQKAVEVCDVCAVNPAFESRKCDECGLLICFDCEKEHAVKYRHSIWTAGGEDGFYCLICNDRLTEGRDPLIAAYEKVANLLAEYDRFLTDFTKRATEAQHVVCGIVSEKRKTKGDQ